MVFSQTNDGQLFSKMFYELFLLTGSVQISEKKSLTDLSQEHRLQILWYTPASFLIFKKVGKNLYVVSLEDPKLEELSTFFLVAVIWQEI